VLVVSGVPQGSVIGPLLFLVYVNDLPEWIVNSIRMFADDTKIWTVITTDQDIISLQSDLNKLADWSDKWLLRFNIDKCKVMHLGPREKVNIPHKRRISSERIERNGGRKGFGRLCHS